MLLSWHLIFISTSRNAPILRAVGDGNISVSPTVTVHAVTFSRSCGIPNIINSVFVMIHYNSNNNAYCRAVNAETFQTIKHNPVWISILLYRRNPYSYSYFEKVICIYSVRGDIDQISANTSSYAICSAPNVYIFVYILIETRIAPLRQVVSQYRVNYSENCTCGTLKGLSLYTGSL